MTNAIKLIAADVDGTLIQDLQELLTPRVRDSILEALPNTAVALVTGRSYEKVEPLLAQLNYPKLWLALAGGTEVRDPSGKIVAKGVIPNAQAGGLLRLLAGYSNVNIFAGNVWTPLEAFKNSESVQAVYVGDLTDNQAEKLRREGKALFPDLFVSIATDAQTPGVKIVFFQPNAATKGGALKIIQSALGVTACETAALGDMSLDIPMFEGAYFSAAMGNAPAEVKAKARIQLPSVEEDGAAVLFEAVAHGNCLS